MADTYLNLADPALLSAIPANFAEEMASFARSIPGSELHSEAEIDWFSIAPDGPHGVLRANLRAHPHTSSSDANDPADLQRRIAIVQDHFRARGAHRLNWRICPDTTPINLPQILTRAGFTHIAVHPCLAVEISSIDLMQSLPTGLVIQEVTDDAMLSIKCAIEQQGFEQSAAIAANYYLAYQHNSYGGTAPWHHYIGWLNEEPVAVAALLLHQGVAGIYGVTTQPVARRQGIAAAMTLHVLRAAARWGYQIATLTSTEMSDSLYRRLGFQPYCSFHHFNYTFNSKDV